MPEIYLNVNFDMNRAMIFIISTYKTTDGVNKIIAKNLFAFNITFPPLIALYRYHMQ